MRAGGRGANDVKGQRGSLSLKDNRSELGKSG